MFRPLIPDRQRDITNAMTGELLGHVPHCSPDDVVSAAGRARAVQAEWAARPVSERAAVLLRFHDLVLQRQDEILDLIQLENGKARRARLRRDPRRLHHRALLRQHR